MRKSARKSRATKVKPQDYAVVVFAEDMEQAKEYEAALKADSIPVFILEPEESDEPDKGIAVMVPEDFIDEASVIVESQNIYDDLYELGMEEEQFDDSDFDDEIF